MSFSSDSCNNNDNLGFKYVILSYYFNNIINLNITGHIHDTLPNITLSFQPIIVCNGMAPLSNMGSTVVMGTTILIIIHS